VFVHCKPFYDSIVFVGKARAYRWSDLW